MASALPSPVPLAARRRPGRGPSWPRLTAVLGWLALLAGTATVLAQRPVGLIAMAVGVLGVAASRAQAEEQAVLDRIGAVALRDVAAPLPVLPAVSSTPARDALGISRIAPAIVRLPDEGWGVVGRETAEAALDRPGFTGAWHKVARPAPVLDGAAPVATLRRLPRGDEALLIARGDAAPWGLTAPALRSAAGLVVEVRA